MIGIVDNGREKIQGLDEGGVVVETIDPGIFVAAGTDNEPRVRGQIQAAENRVQVPRTYFGRST
jgi:hypothetical protein